LEQARVESEAHESEKRCKAAEMEAEALRKLAE